MGTRVTTTAIKSKCKTKKRRVGSFQDGRFLKWLEHLAKVGGSGLRTEQEGGAAHSQAGKVSGSAGQEPLPVFRWRKDSMTFVALKHHAVSNVEIGLE